MTSPKGTGERFMRILLVSTGGTIGSSAREIMDTDRGKARILPRLLPEAGIEAAGKITFEFLEPFSVLSENMTPDRLMMLLRTLGRVDFSAYDGVILTHGSDTLSYTAAFVGLLFGRVECPVVLVAADRPLEDPAGNGPDNFAGAVALIASGRVRSGAFVVYRSRTVTEVFLATRVLEADGLHGVFAPFGDAPFGRVEGGRFLPQEAPELPPLLDFSAAGRSDAQLEPSFSRPVWMLKGYPGLMYTMFDLSRPPAAVLYLGYHSGTACTEGEDTSFLVFVNRLRERRVPVYFLPARAAGERIYASTAAMLSAGCRPLCGISPEAAYAKLCIGYNCFSQQAEAYLFRNVFYEYLD